MSPGYRKARCVIRTRSLRHCSIRRQTDFVLASICTGIVAGHAGRDISFAYAAANNASTALIGFSNSRVRKNDDRDYHKNCDETYDDIR
jgi:hypothetical protein